MNETLIRNWNSVVKQGDIVYHLGDVFFGNKEDFKKIWPRLNGGKRLIVGNHDDINWLSSGGFFKKVYMWRQIPELDVVLTHVPIYMGVNEHRKYSYNIHGHVHQHSLKDSRYFNVSVENINYTPINLYEVVERLKNNIRS